MGLKGINGLYSGGYMIRVRGSPCKGVHGVKVFGLCVL